MNLQKSPLPTSSHPACHVIISRNTSFGSVPKCPRTVPIGEHFGTDLFPRVSFRRREGGSPREALYSAICFIGRRRRVRRPSSYIARCASYSRSGRLSERRTLLARNSEKNKLHWHRTCTLSSIIEWQPSLFRIRERFNIERQQPNFHDFSIATDVAVACFFAFGSDSSLWHTWRASPYLAHKPTCAKICELTSRLSTFRAQGC